MTGAELLQEIATFWKVDRAHTRWREDGFDWQPGSYLVRVRAFAPREKNPDARWRLTVETELVRSLSIDDATFADELACFGPVMTPTYSLVYPSHPSMTAVGDGAFGLR
ncbi:MAG TPA: hypothetical protein VHN20_17515, partial [Beijerinckiaceae bacterium]|nr:hypothetical protein [Beijerinckiaceae bacterium]